MCVGAGDGSGIVLAHTASSQPASQPETEVRTKSPRTRTTNQTKREHGTQHRCSVKWLSEWGKAKTGKWHPHIHTYTHTQTRNAQRKYWNRKGIFCSVVWLMDWWWWINTNQRIKSTNRPVEGWDSIYRSMVTALISTSPRQVSKSSTEDSAPQNLAVYFVTRRQQATLPRRLRMPYLHKWAVSSIALFNDA